MSTTVTTRSRRRRASRNRTHATIAHPRGRLHPRVQQVGPERFGLLCIDCAKARTEWMLADFYGRVLWPATTVRHTRGEMEAAMAELHRVMREQQIDDAVAVVERTGSYHLLVKRVLEGAGWQVRIVHPYATCQYRQPADPGNKTDQTDLMAIHRAAVAGLGLLEQELDEPYRHLRLLVRHRRDLVQKASALRCQIQEHLHAAMPGFAQLFDDLWDTRVPMIVAQAAGSPQAVADLGEDGLTRLLNERRVLFQRRTVTKILAWARSAPAPDADAALHRHLYTQLEHDHLAQRTRIQDAERRIAHLLVDMPYVLLLSVPGIHVVSAAELAGEMGPISHYAAASHITGRAGLFPSRYQSDRTDHADGPLVNRGNRRLRTALMTIADNLVNCNAYFGGQAQLWRKQGKDARMARVKVAKTFSRIAFQMLAGRQVFRHPCCRERAYILDKLIDFARDHKTPPDELLPGLRAAAKQIPPTERAAEAKPLHKRQRRAQRTPEHRTSQPQRLGEILPLVLAELGQATAVQSGTSGSQDPG